MTKPQSGAKTWIEVSRANLLHNFREFARLAPKGTSLMPVIKANAYGHGLREATGMLGASPAPLLAVDSLEEARLARQAAKKPVLILDYIPATSLPEALAEGFGVSIYSPELLRAVQRIARGRRIPPFRLHLHLKIETGTNRLGIRPEELARVNISVPIEGLYTHFADSEDEASPFMGQQTEKLREAREILRAKGIEPRFIHSACTAAAIRGAGGNLIRLGLGLYGLWPDAELKARHLPELDLRPALSWRTRIAQVKLVPKGETVGYGKTWKARRATRIAVLPLGYFDGFDRRLSNCGEALVNGARCPVIGRVCMNMTMVALGDTPAKPGDEATLIGRSGRAEITAEDVARAARTINYEIVSRLNPLLKRLVR